MKRVLLDTHAWAWSLLGGSRLSAPALAAMTGARQVLVCPISLYEIGQKVRLGKWPAMEPYVDRLPGLAEEQGSVVTTLEPSLCWQAAMLEWRHRDPFDRLLAATALRYDLPIVSMDKVFDGVVTRVW